MKKKKSRILSLFLAALFVFMGTNVYANEQEEFVEDPSIAIVDALIDQRTRAAMNEDWEQYDALTQELEKNGAETISYDELCRELNMKPKLTPYTANASSSYNLVRTYGSIEYNGKKYEWMRVYTTPLNTSCSLAKTGVVGQTSSKSIAANAMKILEITASSIAGTKYSPIGVAQTVYSALSDMIDFTSPSQVISDIQASYTWTVSEICVFLFFKNAANNWDLGAQFSKVSTDCLVGVPQILVGGRAHVGSFNVHGESEPSNYNTTLEPIRSYAVGAMYVSRIRSASFKGLDGKTIVNVALQNPYYPGDVY